MGLPPPTITPPHPFMPSPSLLPLLIQLSTSKGSAIVLHFNSAFFPLPNVGMGLHLMSTSKTSASFNHNSDAVETLLRDITVLIQPYAANDKQCCTLISLSKDCLHGIEAKSYSMDTGSSRTSYRKRHCSYDQHKDYFQETIQEHDKHRDKVDPIEGAPEIEYFLKDDTRSFFKYSLLEGRNLNIRKEPLSEMEFILGILTNSDTMPNICMSLTFFFKRNKNGFNYLHNSRRWYLLFFVERVHETGHKIQDLCAPASQHPAPSTKDYAHANACLSVVDVQQTNVDMQLLHNAERCPQHGAFIEIWRQIGNQKTCYYEIKQVMLWGFLCNGKRHSLGHMASFSYEEIIELQYSFVAEMEDSVELPLNQPFQAKPQGQVNNNVMKRAHPSLKKYNIGAFCKKMNSKLLEEEDDMCPVAFGITSEKHCRLQGEGQEQTTVANHNDIKVDDKSTDVFFVDLAGIKLPDQNAADQLNVSLFYVPKKHNVVANLHAPLLHLSLIEENHVLCWLLKSQVCFGNILEQLQMVKKNLSKEKEVFSKTQVEVCRPSMDISPMACPEHFVALAGQRVKGKACLSGVGFYFLEVWQGTLASTGTQ
ncbi:Cleavage and polyadenylation specificity factor subunit 7, partial [Ophiophagus hannah]